MPIPESQLELWSHQGSIAQSRDTYATIKRAIESPTAKYAARSYEVFLQGSYRNDTNVYAESDVDVVIRLDDIYYYDIAHLSSTELTSFNSHFIPATYTYADYKAEVVSALKERFGDDLTLGNKALRIKANGSRRNGDVVVAAQFRRYYPGTGLSYEPGICFFTADGTRVANFPQKHSANCTMKHQATGGWFKPMVRILKNMRQRLLEDSIIEKSCAPSYFLEGLLYNVPSDKFGKSYSSTFIAAMTWITENERSTFLCANEQYYLARDFTAECWPCGQCDSFIDAAVQMWNNW